MWTRDQVRGAMWALEHVLALAQLTDREADRVVDLILEKFVVQSGLDPATFREIVQAMDPDEGLCAPTQH